MTPRPAVTRQRPVRRAVGVLVPLVALVALGIGGVAAGRAGGNSVLADRSRPGVQAEEARVTALLRHGEPSVAISPSDCRVRLMRQTGSTSWVWTVCHVIGSEVGQSWAGPVRVDAETLWVPDPVSGDDGVREHFPADLVDLALGGNNRFLAELGVPVPSG